MGTAALTWRDVAEPNFNTSLGAQALAGRSLSDAFSGLSDSLGKFHEWQQGQAANALANNQAQYPDAASQAAAVKNGTLFNGVDRSNLTPEALKGIDSRATTLLGNALVDAQTKVEPTVGTLNSANASDALARAGQTRQTTSQGATTFARGTTAYNAGLVGQAAGLKAASGAQTAADVISAVNADPTVANDPLAKQAAIEHGMTLLNGTYNPANAAIAAAAGASAMPSGGSMTVDQQAAQIKALNPQLTNQECVTLAMKATGMTGSVTDWRRGSSWGDVPVGGGAATFMNRDGSPSTMYDGGGIDPATGKPRVGIRKNDTTHALVKAPDAADGTPQAWEQYEGSGGPHLVQLHNDDSGGRIHNINNLYGINGADGKTLGNVPASTGNSLPVDPMSDFYTSLGAATRVSSDIGAKVGQLNSSGISGVYGDASRSSIPAQQVVDGLVATKDFSTVGPEKIKAGLDAIKQAGAKYNLSLNDSEAGAILSENAASDPIWFKTWRGGSDNLNLNSDAIDAEVKQIAKGSREKQLQQVNAATNSAAVVDQLKQAASDAFGRWRQASAVAAQRPETANSVEPARKTYLTVKAKLDQAITAAQQNSNLKPVFPLSGNDQANGAPAALSAAVAPNQSASTGAGWNTAPRAAR